MCMDLISSRLMLAARRIVLCGRCAEVSACAAQDVNLAWTV
jgi:hypothetical protein